ncbi:MAG: plastocyanin/azurin family copper-binding protein [Candidatus Dormibacter sp.]
MIVPASTGRRPGTRLRSPASLLRIPALVAALALAGCAGPGGNQPPLVNTLHLSEYRIMPAQLSLDAGIYTFTAVNNGTISHALELTGNGIDGHTPDLAFGPGHSEGFTVTLKPGTYQFFCPIDGHQGLGMQATLVVH